MFLPANNGIFVPMRAKNGEFCLNAYRELKFCAPDGLHKCLVLHENWVKGTLRFDNNEEVTCYGVWRPDLDINNSDHQEQMKELGLIFSFNYASHIC